ncbi:hypothetical protein [uncultured Sphingomonas sp.]|uniref:hypothetical protein n=1 Tax=uncultured Sphingomonas sp. TaxID=158754 RepID=UPI0025F6288D|nr:hypothetical protein [uncultured Sphingomonas sp.]
MQCPLSPAAADAITRSPRSASAPATVTPTEAPSGPAETTEPQPPTGTDERIEKRAARLQFNNEVQRQKYLQIHQTLSRRSCEVTA